MDSSWLWLTLGSGLSHGVSEIFKKQSLRQLSVFNVLFLYSITSFLIVIYNLNSALSVSADMIFLVLIKSILMFASWAFGFKAIQNLPISIYSPLSTLSPLFVVLYGIVLFGEQLNPQQFIGITTILSSYLLIGTNGEIETGNLLKNRYFYFVLLNSLLSATSAMLDKIILKSVTTGQMQFWNYLFLSIMYGMTLYQRTKTQSTPIRFSIYVLLIAVFLVLSDKWYFDAVGMPSSQISLIMPIKRISVFVSAILGGLIFREQHLVKKAGAVAVVILGMFIVFTAK